MKRSKKALLCFMLPATTLMLSSCEDSSPEQALVFNSVEECNQSGLSTWDQCNSDFEAANAIHPEVAPKYQNKSACEADFGEGKCESVNSHQSSGSGMFMPMMMGFMAANMMNNRAAPNYYSQQQQSSQASNFSGGSRPFVSQPLYRSRDDQDGFRTASNVRVANHSGAAFVQSSDLKVKSGQTVSRGGFGSQAAMRGSFGG